MMPRKQNSNIHWMSIILLTILKPGSLISDPGPGDIYREYVYNKMLTFYEKEVVKKEAKLIIDDLQSATRAELSSVHFSGHCNTGPKSFTVNGNNSILLPVPEGTAEHPDLYFAFLAGNNSAEIPLIQLKQGENEFVFTDGGCSGVECCGWPAYEIHMFVIRIFYNSSKSHPMGKIANPFSGAKISDNVHVKAEANATSPESNIVRVDFLGYYEDYPFEGAGPFTKWHYQYPLGKSKDDRPEMISWCVYGEPPHIGTDTTAPYEVTWDNEWIPDQDGMKIMARIVDSNGMFYMTKAIDNLSFKHKDKIVKLYAIQPEDLPLGWWAFPTRRGIQKAMFHVDDDLKNAQAALLVANIAQYGVILLNSKQVHYKDKGMDRHPRTSIPLNSIKHGENVFEVTGKTDSEHLHTCWPGPAIKIAFKRK